MQQNARYETGSHCVIQNEIMIFCSVGVWRNVKFHLLVVPIARGTVVQTMDVGMAMSTLKPHIAASRNLVHPSSFMS